MFNVILIVAPFIFFRFRSITKQYFRKADGVVVMYDVTSESSFRSVRNWMTSVQDGTEEGTVLLVVGNKMDLVANDGNRVVTSKDGIKLADVSHTHPYPYH